MGKKSFLSSAFLMVVYLFTACGGGSVGGIGGSSSTSGSPSGGSISASPSTITTGGTFNVTWTGGSNGTYQLLLGTSNNPATAKSIFSVNCGASLFACGTGSNTAVCTYTKGTSGGTVSCITNNSSATQQQATINFTGAGYAIGQGCAYDSNINLICANSSQAITVSP